MWFVMFILLFLLALILLMFSVAYERNPFWNLVGAGISSFIWLILSLSQMQIEIPYTAITSSDTIVTGVHTYTDPLSPYLTYFFFGLFAVLQIYIWALVWDYRIGGE